MHNHNPKASKKEIFGWCMFDFANSAYTTVIITAVFNVYFVDMVATQGNGNFLWLSVIIPISYLLVVLTGPILGAIADFSGAKKKFLFVSYVLCVTFTALLFFVKPGDVYPAMVLLILSNIGFAAGENFASAFLPDLASPGDMGKVSGYAWSFGYWGGLLALVVCLTIVLGMSDSADKTLPMRLSALVTAVFFGLAAIPTFLWLKERSANAPLPSGYTYVTIGFKRLRNTYQNISQFKELIKFLLTFLVFNCGVMIIITYAAIYASQVLKFSMSENIVLIIVVNITASVGAFLFGSLQDKIGSKKVIIITLILWIVTVIGAYLSQSKFSFWFIANIAGVCLGSTQSAARAMVGLFSPEAKSGEFFGFWGLAGKIGAIIGPLSLGWIATLLGDNARLTLVVPLAFFVAGAIGMFFCDERKGIAAARSYTDN